jgi:lysine-specific demethylase 8
MTNARNGAAAAGALEPTAQIEAIERIPAPSPEDFRKRFLRPRCPVILTGVTADWLAPEEWSIDGLAARHGDARVIAAALTGGRLQDDPRAGVVFEKVELRRFVASLGDPGSASHYVMAPTWNFGPDLEREYRVPPYCAGAPHLRAKVWLGKAGTVTPMHRDVPHNLHVHLTGRKRWLLFSPRENRHVYPRGLLSSMPNFAEVDPERPDYGRHPRFREARGLGATLEPGETLFIPHGWWHHTRSLEDATSMNFWWADGPLYLATLASAAFKRMTRIREDEWG